MSEVSKRLRDRRQNVWEQAKQLADVAAEENRQFTAEEQGSWDALNEEIANLDKRIKSVLDGEARAKEADEQFNRINSKTPELGRKPADQSQESQEMRAFFRGEGPRAIEIKPSGQYTSATQYRDLVKSGATTGGNLVPTSFYDRLVAHLIETSSMLQSGVTILNTGGGETIQVPKTTAHSSASIITEGATITESDPAFGQISLGAFKYGTMIQVSRELVDDDGVDLEGYLAMQAGRALGNALGAHLVTGTGTGQPRGVVTDATVGVTGGTTVSGAFTADNLIDLHYSVIAPYRASSAAVWLMRDATIASVRKLKDANGQYLFQPSLVAGTPDTLLGKPILTEPNVAAVALSAKSVVFGDMSQYFVRLAGGVRFERSDDFAFGNDLITYRALLRGDGALVDLTGAVKVFQGAAT